MISIENTLCKERYVMAAQCGEILWRKLEENVALFQYIIQCIKTDKPTVHVWWKQCAHQQRERDQHKRQQEKAFE